jgi:hypothetical protein
VSLIKEYYKNYYGKEDADVTEDAAKTVEALETTVNAPFTTYLLTNTDKSIEKISSLTNSSFDIVSEYAKTHRK